MSQRLKNLQFSNLKTPLPENVHILSLEPWNNNTVLLRLEHILEKNDDENLSKEVTVDLTDLFTKFAIKKLVETALGGNMLIEESVRLKWPGQENTSPKKIDGLKVSLAPMEIRTFLAKVVY